VSLLVRLRELGESLPERAILPSPCTDLSISGRVGASKRAPRVALAQPNELRRPMSASAAAQAG
jgi:hypothetical protein